MAVVGRAELLVTAVTAGVKKQITDALREARKDIATQGKLAGTEYGKKFRKAARDEIKAPLTKIFRDSIDTAKTAGRDAGAAYGEAMRKAVAREALGVGEEFASALDKSFDKSADKAAKNVGKRMSDNLDDAEKTLDKFNKDVQKFSKKFNVVIEPEFDIRSQSLDQLERLNDEFLRRASEKAGGRVDLPLGVNILSDDFFSQLDTAVRRHKQAQEDMRTEKKRTDEEFKRSFAGRLQASIQKLTDSVRRMIPQWQAARRAFAVLYGTGAAVGTGLSVLGGIISSLGSAFGALVGAVGEAAAALVVLPSLLTAAAQAMLTLRAAFAGVGGALSSAFKAAEESAKSAGSAAVDNSKAIRDARERLADAYADAAWRQQQAEQRVQDATRDLADAVLELERAQSRLNDAYERGREELEDLAFQAEGAAIAEEEAALRLEDAVIELSRVQNLPPDNRARREAELAYQRAELAYRQAKDRNEDLAKAQEEAAEAGVEGTDAVLTAKQEIADAEEDVADKQRALVEAEQAAFRAAQQSARAIRDARQALADAMNAAKKGIDDGAKALDEFVEKLKELPFQAQLFVIEILKLRPALERLKTSAATGFFREINDSVGELQSLFSALNPIVFYTAQVLGELADEFINLVTSAGFLDRLKKITDTNTDSIRSLGGALIDVIDGFANVLIAADPLVRRFTEWIERISERFREYTASTEGMQEMEDMFNRSGDVAADFGEIIGNLIDVWQNYLDVAGPAIDYTLERLKESTEEWARSGELTGAALQEQQDGILQGVKNSEQFLGLLGDLLRLFQELGKEASLEETFSILREGVPLLREMLVAGTDAGPAFARLVVAVADLFAAFAESDAMIVFFDTLTLITESITDFVRSDVGQQIIVTLAPLLAITKAITLAWMPLAFLFKAFAGTIVNLLRPVGAVVKYLSKWTGTTSRLSGAVKGAQGGIGGFAKLIGRVVLIGSRFTVIIGAVVTVFAGLWKALRSNDRLEKFKDLWERIGRLFSSTVAPILGKVFDKINFIFDILTTIVGGVLGLIIDGFLGFTNAILDVVEIGKRFTDTVKGWISPVTNFFSTVGGWFSGGKDDVDEYAQAFSDADRNLKKVMETEGVAAAKEEYKKFEQQMLDAGYSVEEIAEQLPDYNAALEETDAATDAARRETEKLAASWEGLADEIDRVLRAVDELRGGVMEVGEAEDNLAQVQEETNKVIREAGSALTEQSEAGRNARDALRDQSDAVFDWLKANETAYGAAFDYAGEYEKKYEEMAKTVAAQTGLAGEELEAYLETVGLVPPDKLTELKIDDQTARLTIDEYILNGIGDIPEEVRTDAEFFKTYAEELLGRYNAKLDGIPEDVLTQAELDDLAASRNLAEWDENLKKTRTYKIQVQVDRVQNQQGGTWYNYNLDDVYGALAPGRSAEGGPIVGPGGPTDDKAGLFALSNGEYVLSAAAVKAMGGLSAVDEFHRDMKRSVSRSRSDTSFNPYNPNVMTIGEQAIVEEIRALRNQDATQSGMSVSIGSISTASPDQTASEIITAMRAERWRMGVGL